MKKLNQLKFLKSQQQRFNQKLRVVVLIFGASLFAIPAKSFGLEVVDKSTLEVKDIINQTITGTVTDKDGSPIPGVSIQEKGTSNGTSTDFDGNFSISVANNNAILIVSSVGYKTREVSVSTSKMTITLEESTESLDEIVVIGYGTKKKSLVTGAISSIASKDIQTASVQRVDQALQGRTSGVTVTSSSGAPGAGAKIRIRGTGSNGNSNPLFIVDGMKVLSIDNIPPSDIANIEILKDAASSAIYGTEGANGVIIITTKGGRAGEISVNFNSQTTIQTVNTDMELMNASQFVQYMNEAGISSVTDNGINTNWLEETFVSAPMFRNDFSISGGFGKTSIYLSASDLSQEGIVGGSNSTFDRSTVRLNLKSELAKWVEVGANLTYSKTDRIGVQENNDTRGVIQNALILDPLTPVTYNGRVPQSVIDRSVNNGVPLLRDRRGRVYGYPSFSTGEVLNPVALANGINRSISDDNNFLSTLYAKFTILEGLTFTSRFGYERGNFNNQLRVLPYFVSSEAQNTSFILNNNDVSTRRWLWENFVSYDKTLGNHDFTLLAGYSAEDTDVNTASVNGAIAVDQFTGFNLDQGFTLSNENDFEFLSNLVSAYARLSYGYKEKYLFEASLRADRSDKFPTVNKTGIFPAVSGGWVISKEDFWKDSNVFDYVKLRASWGQNGSIGSLPGNTDRTFITTLDNNLPIVYLGATGAQITSFANTNLVWETSEQLDFGVDFRMFNNTVRFSADYYKKTTRDLIINDGSLITPGSAGFNFSPFNAGTIENQGFEFELGYSNQTSGGLGYNIDLNLSTLQNEVTEILFVPEGTSINGASAPQNPDGITRFTEGLPVWYFFGFKTDGIDPATGEIIRVDTNGDGTVNNLDKTFIGNPHPDLLFGGNVALNYKAFDFNLRFQGTIGNDIIATYHQPSRPITNKPVHFFENRWTQPGDVASFPGSANVISSYDTDLVVEDASFMRIKQLQFGYTLPSKITDKINANNFRIYISLDDYFTFTKYRGLDPEIGNSANNDTGVDRGFYPTPAKALFGLSVNF